VPRGVPSNVPPSGNALGRAAFAMAMRRLAEVESMPVYAELCAEADARHLAESRRVKAANGRVTGDDGKAELSPAQEAAWKTGRTHGRIGTYNDGCRCDECSAASAEYRRNRRSAAS
jgi:hypothetical protein